MSDIPPPPTGLDSGAGGLEFQGVAGREGESLIGGMDPYFQGDVAFGSDPSTGRFTRYYEGDELKPYDWGDPNQVAEFQAALAQAGFLAQSRITGGWDATSANGLKAAMAYANKLGIPLSQLLSQLAADRGSGAGGGGGRGGGGGGGVGPAPLTDEDVRALGDQVSKAVLGRKLRDEEFGGFNAAFRGMLAAGTSPQVSAENVIREQSKFEAYGHDIGSVLQKFNQMLGGR